MSDLDQVLGFTIAARHARGRVVRLGPVLENILAAHGYPPVIERLLAEALVLTAMLGSTLKNAEGQMTLQAQTADGVVSLLVCDYQGGALRGYVKHDPERLAALPQAPTLDDLFNKGYLAITFDQATSGERYQGIVPLEGQSLAEAAESYFSQSEQIPSLVRIDMTGDIAGGILLQHLPEGEDGRDRIHTRLDHPEWDQVTILGQTIKGTELTDPDLALDRIVWRLFNEEEVRVFEPIALSKGCRCNPDHVRDVILKFPEADRAEMADEKGIIAVDCAFCAKIFSIKAP
ncbi:MAG: Hsp33 family molecular chaperone HslO [Chakrabartia sp.]